MVLEKLPPSPNSNANPKPNPDPDRGAIFRTPLLTQQATCLLRKETF